MLIPMRMRSWGKHMAHVASEKVDAAFGRPMLACNELEEGALPCAVRPDNAADFAGIHLKVDAVNHMSATETFL